MSGDHLWGDMWVRMLKYLLLLCGLCLSYAVSSQSCNPPAGYEAFWSYDTAVGVNDVSANNRDTTGITGTAQLSTQRFVAGNQSIYFDGSSSLQYSQNSVFMSPAFNEKTLLFWLKPDTLADTQIVYEEGTLNRGMVVRLVGQRMEVRVRQNAANVNDLGVNLPVDTNWHHFAIVFAGQNSAFSARFEIYVDGVLTNSLASASVVNFSSGGFDPGGVGGGIGNNAYGDSSNHYYSGYLDDVYTYLTVLADTDIINTYYCGNICLIAGTPCDDNNANTYNDIQDGNCGCAGTLCPTFTVTPTNQNNTCFTAPNGSIQLAVSGGSSPYTYNWSNDSTTSSMSNLSAGSYAVTITDNNNCVTLDTFILTEPAEIIITIDNSTDPTTNFSADGSISISVAGGITPFTYLWNNGSTTEDISGLVEDEYKLFMNDSAGCQARIRDTLDGITTIPNVIIIMPDDLGYGDVGFTGFNNWETPFIDSLSEDGTILNRFYTASSVCSPSRASILTGQNPIRAGVPSSGTGRLDTNLTVLPELLQSNGFNTGMFGKWHLGGMSATTEDAKHGGQPNFFSPPWLHGYDTVFATETTVPTFDAMKKTNSSSYPTSFADTTDWYGSAFWTAPASGFEGTRVGVNNNLAGDVSNVVMDRVLPFIDSAHNNNKPFFASVWLHSPHTPVVLDSAYKSSYNAAYWNSLNDEEKAFANAITSMDSEIGRLMTRLINLGIDEETMIWFFSDNGAVTSVPTSNGNFRSGKGTFYEGGIRSPAFIKYPGEVTSGATMAAPMSTSDIMPTVLDWLSIAYPSQIRDGKSMITDIKGVSTTRGEPIGLKMVDTLRNQLRKGLITDCYKLYKQDSSAWEVYDLTSDETELSDLSNDTNLLNYLRNEYLVFENSLDSNITYVVTGGFDGCSPPVATEALSLNEDSTSNYWPNSRDLFQDLILLYPNPTQGNVTVDVSYFEPEAMQLEVIDMSGTILRRIDASEDSGIQFVSLQMDHLPAGMYFIRLLFNNDIYVKRVMLTD